MSAGVADMCQQYLEKSRAAFPDTEYMFPSPTGEPYQKRWLADTFRRLWDASKLAGNSTKVRVYLLRHRYATAMFMKWLDEKTDLNAMLPYLSAYMGHSNFFGYSLLHTSYAGKPSRLCCCRLGKAGRPDTGGGR